MAIPMCLVEKNGSYRHTKWVYHLSSLPYSKAAVMETIRELEGLLVPDDAPSLAAEGGNGLRIVVLKQFRFHSTLCIELYDAGTTQSGKIKNPLLPFSASDAALYTNDPDALIFYTSVSRFQYNPTASKTAADIRALKTIFKNPLSLRFFLS